MKVLLLILTLILAGCTNIKLFQSDATYNQQEKRTRLVITRAVARSLMTTNVHSLEMESDVSQRPNVRVNRKY